MTTAGAVTRFRALTGRTSIGEIEYLTAGPDGNVWFTHGRKIGRITPEGRVTRFPARESRWTPRWSRWPRGRTAPCG